MTNESRVARAKEFHRQALKAGEEADRCRRRRDEIIREVYAQGGWSYKVLARTLDVSPELIAYIIKRGGS